MSLFFLVSVRIPSFATHFWEGEFFFLVPSFLSKCVIITCMIFSDVLNNSFVEAFGRYFHCNSHSVHFHHIFNDMSYVVSYQKFIFPTYESLRPSKSCVYRRFCRKITSRRSVGLVIYSPALFSRRYCLVSSVLIIANLFSPSNEMFVQDSGLLGTFVNWTVTGALGRPAAAKHT